MSLNSNQKRVFAHLKLDQEAQNRFSQLLEKGSRAESALDSLIDLIDDSHYSLNDWVLALNTFDQWLEDQQITARPLPEMVSYLHCAQLTSAETLSPPNLSHLLTTLLDEYGFEAVSSDLK